MDYRFYLGLAAGGAAVVGLVLFGRDVNTPQQIDVDEPIEARVEQLVNDDCNVGFIYDQIRETILAHDGEDGLSVGTTRVELSTSLADTAGFIGYDSVRRSLYFRAEEGPKMFFDNGYVPHGDAMACDLATRLLLLD